MRGWTAVAVSLLILTAPCWSFLSLVEAQDTPGYVAYAGFDPRHLTLVDNVNTTVTLVIRTEGGPVQLNVSGSCNDDMVCEPISYLNYSIPSPGTTGVEIPFTPRINVSDQNNERHHGSFQVMVAHEGRKIWTSLRVTVIPPISCELLAPFKEYRYYESYANRTDIYYGGLMVAYKATDLHFRISNLDDEKEFRGYFGAIVEYYSDDGTFFEEKRLVVPEEVIVPPAGSVTLVVTIPTIKDTDWDRVVVTMAYSEEKGFSDINFLHTYYSPTVGSEAKGGLSVVRGLITWLSDPDDVDRDDIYIWNGTRLVLNVLNSDTEPREDVDVVVRDQVGPFSSFSYVQYWSETKVSMGDFEPFEQKAKNITIHSSISGPHWFRPFPDEGKGGYDHYVFIRSGLNLKYLDEDIFRVECKDYDDPSTCKEKYFRTAELDDKLNFRLWINNTKGYTGEFGISIHQYDSTGLVETGSGRWNSHMGGNKEIINGNGWASEDLLADIEFGDTLVRGGNGTYSFTVRPRMPGALVLIPYVKVGDRVLLFDENEADQEFISYKCSCIEDNKYYSDAGYPGVLVYICVHHEISAVSVVVPGVVPLVVANLIVIPVSLRIHFKRKKAVERMARKKERRERKGSGRRNVRKGEMIKTQNKK